MKKVKILYLIDKKAQAGAQNHLQELIQGLNREVFEAELITLRELGIKRICGISGVRGLIKLIRYMKINQFDIVQSYLFSENILGVIAAKIAGVKTIITGRRDTGMLMQGKWQHILAYRLTNRWVDKIVCVSEAVKKVALAKERLPAEKLKVIYNGVDIDKFAHRGSRGAQRRELGIKDGQLVVGMLANFSWIKGHLDFIEAAEFVLKEIPNTKFLLIGDGPLLEGHKVTMSQSHQLKDKVLFLGSRQDIPELLSIMDVSVNASYSEGMSNTILESMAAGVPVVATGVDGNLETVIDKESGVLVPPKRPLVMANAIISILKDRALARRMWESAKKLTQEKFDSRIMVSNFEELYLKLIQSKTAFLLSQFPETHETFILREFMAIKDRMANFSILSLKPCKDKVVHPEAVGLMNKTIYGRALSLQPLLFSLRHPLKAIKSFGYIIRSYFMQPKELIKALYVWLECFYLADIAKRERITHIHSHWATIPTTAAVVLSKLTGISYSFTAHAWDIYVNNSSLVNKINNAKFVVTCTDYNRKYLEELVSAKCKVQYPNLSDGLVCRFLRQNAKLKCKVKSENEKKKIYLNYHGVELDKFSFSHKASTIGDRPLRILAIGRLVEQKGFECLINACKVLNKRGVNFECSIVGEGPLRHRIEHLAISHRLSALSNGSSDRVEFLGVQTQGQIKKLFEKTDIFVAPSIVAKNKDRDGIPNVILEAMALGVPVVASDVSGIPEAVINGDTGILVPERNCMSLALAIENLWADPESGKRLALNARTLIEEKFDAGKNGKQLIDVFKKNLEGVESAPVNVMYIIWSLAMGGAERVVINLAKGLDRDKFNPIVCCLNNKGIYAKELENQGIKVIALNKRGKFDFTILSKLVRLMKMYKIQVVHTHLWGANLWGRLAALLARVPFIIATEHNLDPWKKKYHLIIDKYLSRHTHKVIAVSNTVKDFYVSKAKISSNRITVIHNGIELDKFSFAKKEVNGEFMLGVIGRLVPQKGHRYFLMALKDLMHTGNIKGLIVGSGPEEKKLKELCDKIGLNGSVRFIGFKEDIPALLKEIDIMVLPSLREGLPMIALEAMASGVPVVATRVGGTPELITDRETGLLVDSQDHQALKDSIETLITDKYLMEQLRNNARKKVEADFSSNRMVTKTEELYHEAIRN